MDGFRKTILGKTGIQVSRLGFGGSYGAPGEAFEEAYDKGCNYFYFGSGRRKAGMRQAIKNLCSKGKRSELVIAVQTYARKGILTDYLFNRTLKSLGLKYADILMLGWHNSTPSQSLIEMALKLKEKGLIRFIGMSGHNRKLFAELAKDDRLDLFQIRYNAAHRGAEEEVFSQLPANNPSERPGIISYTATRWGQLLQTKKIPPDEKPLTSADCYRFAMSNRSVDICLCGPKNMNEAKSALQALEMGPLTSEEMDRIKKIGDYVHSKSKSLF